MFSIAKSNASEVMADLVRDILGDLGILEPPVDALQVARGIGIEVHMNRKQTSRGRIVEFNGIPTITLRPEPRKERCQWTVAHEVGKFLIPRLADRLPDDLAPIDDASREWFANRFAVHLLVPTDWYADDAPRLDHDLIALKLLYRTASYEVLAMRLLDVRPKSIITIFDNGRLTRRLGNMSHRSPSPAEIERECRCEASQSGMLAKRVGDSISVRAWPIHEDGWKREILLTEVECSE